MGDEGLEEAGVVLPAAVQASTTRLQAKKLYRDNKAIKAMMPDGAEEALAGAPLLRDCRGDVVESKAHIRAVAEKFRRAHSAPSLRRSSTTCI